MDIKGYNSLFTETKIISTILSEAEAFISQWKRENYSCYNRAHLWSVKTLPYTITTNWQSPVSMLIRSLSTLQLNHDKQCTSCAWIPQVVKSAIFYWCRSKEEKARAQISENRRILNLTLLLGLQKSPKSPRSLLIQLSRILVCIITKEL